MEDLRHVGASSVPLYLIRNEGDFFRCMRHVQVPGIDNINRIGPGIVANFPKLASSAAHLFGRPKAWEEEGGGDGELGKFVADYHFARGVTALQLRAGGFGGSGGPPRVNPQTLAISWYVNRLGYLLSIGRPAAQVALYYPTNSVWMGDDDSITVTERLTQQLLEHQIDFDYLDEQVLTTVGTLDGGGLKNLSGQVYRGIIIPSSTVITRAALDRLRAFRAQGGKVIFVGRTPNSGDRADLPEACRRSAGSELCRSGAGRGDHGAGGSGIAQAGRGAGPSLPSDHIQPSELAGRPSVLPFQREQSEAVAHRDSCRRRPAAGVGRGRGNDSPHDRRHRRERNRDRASLV